MYIHVYTSECTYHVRTVYIHEYTFQDMSVPCMYMFVFFNNGMYYVCQLTYDSTVHSLYVHGTDMYVHVYARWSGFQMRKKAKLEKARRASGPPAGGELERPSPSPTRSPTRRRLHLALPSPKHKARLLAAPVAPSPRAESPVVHAASDSERLGSWLA